MCVIKTAQNESNVFDPVIMKCKLKRIRNDKCLCHSHWSNKKKYTTTTAIVSFRTLSIIGIETNYILDGRIIILRVQVSFRFVFQSYCTGIKVNLKDRMVQFANQQFKFYDFSLFNPVTLQQPSDKIGSKISDHCVWGRLIL